MEALVKDVGVLEPALRSELLLASSSHKAHTLLGVVRVWSALAARAVATQTQIRQAETGDGKLAFTKEQEADFARAQIKLRALLPPLQPGPLLHLSPRLLLIDEYQNDKFRAEVTAAKDRLLQALVAEEDKAKAKRARMLASKRAPPHHHQQQQQLEEEDVGHPLRSHESNTAAEARSVSDIIESLNMRSLEVGGDGLDDTGDWTTVGASGSARERGVGSGAGARVEKLMAPPAGESLGGEEERLVFSAAPQDEEPPLPATPAAADMPMDPSAPPPPLPGSPPPAPPLTVVAITVTKDKYDGDLRELRLMFEEQMQVLQLRNHILQNKIEALEARLEERS